MLSVGMHCRLLGRPGRRALQRFLDHIERHDRVWACRRIDIARHWKQVHPSTRGLLRMTITLDQFNAATRRKMPAFARRAVRTLAWIVESARAAPVRSAAGATQACAGAVLAEAVATRSWR